MKVKHVEDLQQKLDEKINSSVIIDEDSFVSNSDTRIPTQQSVKAYVDNVVSTFINGFVEVIEEFIPTETIQPNTSWDINLMHSTQTGFSIDVTINGMALNIDQYINIPDTNIVTIQNIPYILDVTDLIRITYKY